MNSNTSQNSNMNRNSNSNRNSNMNSNMSGGSMDSNMNHNSNMSGGSMNSNMSQNSNTGGGMMALSSTDRNFMMTAAMGGMAEVESGRLALQKSTSDSVKQYAQQMIDDHTKANAELMQVAAMKGVTLPTTLDAKHMAMMAKMQRLSGMEFDRMYVKEMGVKAHEKMEKLFVTETMRGRDADAKGFAAKTLPVVRMHLTMARGMMNTMKGTTSSNSNSNMGM